MAMARKSSVVQDLRPHGPNPVDVHVGRRVRLRRTLLGFSQEKLGEALGLTFQQVQKYERGINRIGSSRLFDLSQILGVSINFFFDDMPEEVADNSPAHLRGIDSAAKEEGLDQSHYPQAKRETLELVRAYYNIDEAPVRRSLLELAKALGSSKPGSSGPANER